LNQMPCLENQTLPWIGRSSIDNPSLTLKKDNRNRRRLVILTVLLAGFGLPGMAQNPKPDWKAQVADAMPLLGHRNWILVVDSAYPLETSRGIETIETNADQLTVVRSVLETINSSRHVRPVITLDAELPFVPDQDAPGASAYRAQIGKMLQSYEVQSLSHETILKNIDATGRIFHVLVLKTNMTIPYSSVFIRLDCKYWSADAEKRLRAKMGTVDKVRNKQRGGSN
jgi:RbsD/FucU transport protein family protein